MPYEQTQPPWSRPPPVPEGFRWSDLEGLAGDALEAHYGHTQEEPGRQREMLGLIFRRSRGKVQDPARLQRLIVDLIGREQWTSLSADVRGDAHEGLLQRNAGNVKGGAGQYFTPWALIAALVQCAPPRPEKRCAIPPAAPAASSSPPITTGSRPTIWIATSCAPCAREHSTAWRRWMPWRAAAP